MFGKICMFSKELPSFVIGYAVAGFDSPYLVACFDVDLAAILMMTAKKMLSWGRSAFSLEKMQLWQYLHSHSSSLLPCSLCVCFFFISDFYIGVCMCCLPCATVCVCTSSSTGCLPLQSSLHLPSLSSTHPSMYSDLLVCLFPCVQAISYFIHVLHPVVEKDYVVVYFHTLSNSDNHPELSMLRQLYDMVDNRWGLHGFWTSEIFCVWISVLHGCLCCMFCSILFLERWWK